MSTSAIRQSFCEALAALPKTAVQSKHAAASKMRPKTFSLDEDGSHTDQLLLFLSEEHMTVASQHVTIQKNLSRGLWLSDEMMVEVTTQKGVSWATHGHTSNGKLYLTPYEAVFLMESGNLEVFSDGIPMSIHQAYHRLLKPGTLQQYQVYAYLKRAGYIVQNKAISDIPILEAWHHRIPFRKSHLGPPDYRLLVARPADPFPTDVVLQQLLQVTPQAGVCCAVVDGSSIAIYTLHCTKMAAI